MNTPNATAEKPASWLPTLSWSSITPIIDVSAVVVGKLVELGYANMSRSMERYCSNLQSLTEVRDIGSFIDRQQQFVRSLWDDQQEALQAASEVIQQGFEEIMEIRGGPAAAPATAPAGAPDVATANTKPKLAHIAAVREKSMPPRPKTAVQTSPTGSVFEIYLDRSGAYRFRLKAADGRVLLSSEAYKSRSSAINGVASVKKNASNESRYKIQTSATGKPSFNLKAANHQVIGSSRAFASADRMQSAIKLIQQTAASAAVDDQTQAA